MDNAPNLSRGPYGFIAVDGEHIYYETFGQGDPLVFTHGFGGNHAIWYQQVPEFARDFRVVTWDHRGFGRSSNETNRAGPKTAVSDLKSILDHLDIGQAHLVGQSMGGFVAMGFAIQNPVRTKTLILGDTNAGIHIKRTEEALGVFLRKSPPAPYPSDLPIGQHPALGEKMCRENIAKAFLYEQIGRMAGDPPDNILPLYVRLAYPHEKLKKIKVPVLFIVGGEDPIFSPETVREAAAIIPFSQVVVISHAGHSPYFEDPAQWNATVLDFIYHL